MAKCTPLVFDNYHPSEEDRMARIFCSVANDFFKDVEGNIYALPSLKASREVDLVVWMDFPKYKPTIKCRHTTITSNSEEENKVHKFRKNKDIWFNSCFLVIELKKHNTSDSISIRNGELFCKYEEGFKNVSDQSFNQIHAAKDYIAEFGEINDKDFPRVINLIWLYRCLKRPEGTLELENVIFGEVQMAKLLEQICNLNHPIEYENNIGNYQFGKKNRVIRDKVSAFFEDRLKEKANGIGQISRLKLNNIITKNLDLEQSKYFNEIGEKFTIYRGKPGTGKTIYLANIAYLLKEKDYAPVILTYNKALAKDIERLLYFSGYENTIKTKTLHQFFTRILLSKGFIEKVSEEEIQDDIYYPNLNALYDLIKEDETSPKLREFLGVQYDIVLIDEAQDCEEIEKDLLLKIFGYKNTVISLGKRQVVRNKKEELNWGLNIPVSEKNIVNLKISHRNKNNLIDFFNKFSFIHQERRLWELKENREVIGGKSLLLSTKEYTKFIHNKLVEELIDNDNSKYDLMFLTPNRLSKNANLDIEDKLISWGYNYFSDSNRKDDLYPIDQFRMFNYRSCRGLESWTLVIWQLDEIIKNIKEDYLNSNPEANDEDVLSYINNWLLMILTRVIDTLVITVKDFGSDEVKIIKQIAEDKHFSHMFDIRIE